MHLPVAVAGCQRADRLARPAEREALRAVRVRLHRLDLQGVVFALGPGLRLVAQVCQQVRQVDDRDGPRFAPGRDDAWLLVHAADSVDRAAVRDLPDVELGAL